MAGSNSEHLVYRRHQPFYNPAYILGKSAVSTGGNTNMRLFCPAVGRSPSAAYQSGFLSRGKLHACCSEPPQRVERLLGDAIP